MRDRLAQVFNALQNVETKGQSTLIIADCTRELLAIIREIDEEVAKTKKEESNG